MSFFGKMRAYSDLLVIPKRQIFLYGSLGIGGSVYASKSGLDNPFELVLFGLSGLMLTAQAVSYAGNVRAYHKIKDKIKKEGFSSIRGEDTKAFMLARVYAEESNRLDEYRSAFKYKDLWTGFSSN